MPENTSAIKIEVFIFGMICLWSIVPIENLNDIYFGQNGKFDKIVFNGIISRTETQISDGKTQLSKKCWSFLRDQLLNIDKIKRPNAIQAIQNV